MWKGKGVVKDLFGDTTGIPEDTVSAVRSRLDGQGLSQYIIEFPDKLETHDGAYALSAAIPLFLKQKAIENLGRDVVCNVGETDIRDCVVLEFDPNSNIS